MKTLIIVDTDTARIDENTKTLGEYAKVYDARSTGEIMDIRDREGHIDMIFFSTTVSSLRETITKVRRELKNADAASTTAIYLYGETDPDTLAELFDVGVQDVVPYPIQPAEIGLNRRVPSFFGNSERVNVNFGVNAVSREKIVLVCSPKGGEGKTTTSTQIAAVMAKITNHCLLIDADYAGNAHRKLGLGERSYSIEDFSDEESRYWDATVLESKLILHKQTGLKVLASPLGEYTNVPTDTVMNAFLSYRTYYSNIVIDMHQGFTPTLFALKDYATDIIYVCRPEMDQHERTIETLRKLYDVAPEKVHIIVNAIHEDEAVQPLRVAFEEFKIKAPVYYMPYARTEMSEPGKLPVFADPKKSEYSKKFRSFLKSIQITNAMNPQEKENKQHDKKMGFFSNFFSRSAGKSQ